MLRSFAIPVLVLVTGGTTIQAGGLRSLTAFLVAAMAIIGGVIIDRHDRRFLLLLSSALGAVIFAIFSLWAIAFGVTVGMLTALAIITGVKFGILGNTSNILLRDVVSKEELPEAMSINQGRDAAVEIAGSPLAGFLIGIKPVVPLIAEAVLNICAFISAFFIRIPGRKATDKGPAKASATEHNGEGDTAGHSRWEKVKTTFLDAWVGLGLIIHNPIIRRVAFASVTFSPFLNGVLLLLIFHTLETTDSAVSAGLVNTGVAIGVMIGALIAAKIVKRVPTGTIALIGFLFPIPFAIAALLVPTLWGRVVLLTPLLLMLPAGNAAFGGFVMHLIPHSQMGRYFAVLQVLELVVTPAVMFFVGYGLDRYGDIVTGAVLIAGMCSVVIAIMYRPILAIPTPDKWEEYLAEHMPELSEEDSPAGE